MQREIEAFCRHQGEAERRVAVLQAQEDPETLASVHWLSNQHPTCPEIIEARVEHSRVTTLKLRRVAAQPYWTQAEQLEVCGSYLRLMQVLVGALINQLDVRDRLQVHPLRPLMLFALVENAITHGLESNPAGGESTCLQPRTWRTSRRSCPGKYW